jgi:hypothetical protein
MFISFLYIFRATVPIIRRNNCIYATLGICHSIQSDKYLHTKQSSIQSASTCIPDSHPYRVTSTKCPIETVISPDDGHIVARNM